MSIIANYVRVSDDQLQAWRVNPRFMYDIAARRVPGAEHCDIDKAYQAIAWLLSPIKREEQRRIAGAWPETRDIDPDDSEAWNEAFLGRADADFAGLEPDLLLSAIEGRASADSRDPMIQYGCGNACIFAPNIVEKIDLALKAITPRDFGEHFSADVMAEQMVEPEIWNEGDGLLDEFLRPGFERLCAFFSRASIARQYVVVVYT